MLTTASDLVSLLTRIEDVRSHPALTSEEKKTILMEMRSEIPADRLCRFSPNTLEIVRSKMEKALNDRQEEAGKSPSKARAKAPTESPKD